jgi:hypothetical protein
MVLYYFLLYSDLMAEILLTTEEAASRLSVTPRMVRYLAEPSSGLEKVLVGNRLYFRESDVAALLGKKRNGSNHNQDDNGSREANGEAG